MIAVVIAAFLLGWLTHSRTPVSPQVIRAADLYVVKFALPVLVFSKISRMKINSSMLTPVVIAWSVMMACVVVILSMAKRNSWNSSTTGALLMVGVLGNTSFLGLGMVEGLLGAGHVTTAVAYDQLGTFLGLSVYGSFIVSRFGGGDFSIASVGHRLIRFVPFLALVASVPGRWFNIPDGMYELFDVIGKTVGPVAMGALGLRFSLRVNRDVLQPALTGLLVKMVGIPAMLIGIAIVAGQMDVVAWQSSIIQASMPPMVTAGVVAVGAGLDEDVVAFMVGIGTLFGFVTPALLSLAL